MSRGSGRCRQEISLNDSFDHHGDTTGGALKSSSPQQELEQDSTDNGICLIAFAKKWDQAQFRPKVEISIYLFKISNFKKPTGDTHSYSCSYLQSPHHNKHWNQKLPGHCTLSTVLLKESAQYKQSYSTIKQGTVDCKHTFSTQNSCQVSATTPPSPLSPWLNHEWWNIPSFRVHAKENLSLQPFVMRAHEKGNVADGRHAHQSVMSGRIPSGGCFH